MCGRYTLTAVPEDLRAIFDGVEIPDEFVPRFNIAPSQPVAVISNQNPDKLDFFVWGLIPSWAKDPKIGNRMINARGETLAEKPSFRAAYKRRRCLIPADGFYEWVSRPGEKKKTPHYIQLKSKQPFAMAGLWEYWQSPDGSEIYSCTIITTEPNAMLAKLHNRMPVILPPDAYPLWLSESEQSRDILDPLLVPYPETEMQHYPVSTLVNSPANEVPAVINAA
ncbi:MAG: SOS response-associated peptidase [Chloroflexota bacterium]